jgi:hypothetical protein
MWQPLFAVAEHFGGEWPARARAAFCELAHASEAAEPKELKFLRHVVEKLAELPDDAVLTPAQLLRKIGPTIAGREVSKDLQGKWLGKVGVQSRAERWPHTPNPNGTSDPWRAYAVAEIREAARRWKVEASNQ